MKILAIIDMQNDFVTGALKNDDAKSVIRYIKEKIREAKGQGTTVVYPAHNFCKLDKTKVNISGTEIRSNPEKNKENIDEIFRRYLEDNHIFKEEEK